MLHAAPQSIRHATHGAVAVTQASGGATLDTPFAIASLGKTMTAVAALRLAARGALDLDAPLPDVLPRSVVADHDGLRGLRVRHLLTMTSGLPDYYDDLYFDDALRDPAGVQTPLGAMRHASDLPRAFAPGTRFGYSNTDYVMLGLVMETVTGRSYADLLQDEVFAPAGLQDSFVFGTRPLPADFARGHPDRALVRSWYAGQGMGDGGVISTARDLVRLYNALFVDRDVLPEPMLTVFLTDVTGAGYGMGIEIEDGIVGHSGGDLGYAADIRLSLSSGALALELVAQEDADTDWPWQWVQDR